MTAITEDMLASESRMRRTIDWRGAFWVASGVPALVLFSIGGLAANAGNLSYLVWGLSMLMGFIQSFTYAEIAGLFPHKSGGASIYGASAWLPYSKVMAPISVWCTWMGWSPVLSLGCSIAALYILNALAPIPVFTATSPEVVHWLAANAGHTAADAIAAVTAAATPMIRTWTLFSYHLGPVSFSLNATFFIGVALLFLTFALQHHGILRTANVQTIIGLAVVIPMFIVGVVPLFNGEVNWSNFAPLVPLKAAGAADPGSWSSNSSWTLLLGAMFIAGWSTYGFETAVSYTTEFKNPAKDTFKAIFYSGILCLGLYILVPFAFQGFLGLNGMLGSTIADGSGVADALASAVHGGAILHGLLVMMMVLALLLCIMTGMAGSSRSLYQGSIDGWLPKYLSYVNEHGAPTKAMWTDLIFNIFVLAIASADSTSFFFILAVSNVGYIMFNFINLNAGWIHRMDHGQRPRPWRAPTWILALGTIFSFFNMFFMGAGAKTWNPIALWAGLGGIAVVIPIFLYRHYVVDGGKFPTPMFDDLHLNDKDAFTKKAGILPYVALAAGLGLMLLANIFFKI